VFLIWGGRVRNFSKSQSLYEGRGSEFFQFRKSIFYRESLELIWRRQENDTSPTGCSRRRGKLKIFLNTRAYLEAELRIFFKSQSPYEVKLRIFPSPIMEEDARGSNVEFFKVPEPI